MSENLRLLGKYSAAMESGDGDAVFEFFAENFHSHVTERVNPERVGADIRGDEQLWWQQARSAFPDMTFTVDLLIESDDLVVSNWTVKGTHTGTAFYGLPPSGQPVVFLADHPTTGGYPVVGVVALDDLWQCAQLRPGDSVGFRHVAG